MRAGRGVGSMRAAWRQQQQCSGPCQTGKHYNLSCSRKGYKLMMIERRPQNRRGQGKHVAVEYMQIAATEALQPCSQDDSSLSRRGSLLLTLLSALGFSVEPAHAGVLMQRIEAASVQSPSTLLQLSRPGTITYPRCMQTKSASVSPGCPIRSLMEGHAICDMCYSSGGCLGSGMWLLPSSRSPCRSAPSLWIRSWRSRLQGTPHVQYLSSTSLGSTPRCPTRECL